jgi:hypothetical protein
VVETFAYNERTPPALTVADCAVPLDASWDTRPTDLAKWDPEPTDVAGLTTAEFAKTAAVIRDPSTVPTVSSVLVGLVVVEALTSGVAFAVEIGMVDNNATTNVADVTTPIFFLNSKLNMSNSFS